MVALFKSNYDHTFDFREKNVFLDCGQGFDHVQLGLEVQDLFVLHLWIKDNNDKITKI